MNLGMNLGMNLKLISTWAIFVSTLAISLSACSQTSTSAAQATPGGPPLARETALFEFTRAIPAGKPVYLVFVDADQKVITSYLLEVALTKKEIDISNLSKPASTVLKPPLSFISLTAKNIVGPNPSDATIYPLSPLIYQDKNDNKLVDSGEIFLSTKDYVIYSSKAFSGSYTDTLEGKPLDVTLYVNAGWSQLEYFLYGPIVDTGKYRLVQGSSKVSNFIMKDPTLPGSI
jgi:hypothetical protein